MDAITPTKFSATEMTLKLCSESFASLKTKLIMFISGVETLGWMYFY